MLQVSIFLQVTNNKRQDLCGCCSSGTRNTFKLVPVTELAYRYTTLASMLGDTNAESDVSKRVRMLDAQFMVRL